MKIRLGCLLGTGPDSLYLEIFVKKADCHRLHILAAMVSSLKESGTEIFRAVTVMDLQPTQVCKPSASPASHYRCRT